MSRNFTLGATRRDYVPEYAQRHEFALRIAPLRADPTHWSDRCADKNYAKTYERGMRKL